MDTSESVGSCDNTGMCECVVGLTKHERAEPMERALRRGRIKKEEIAELLHVEEWFVEVYNVWDVCLGVTLFFDLRWFGTCALLEIQFQVPSLYLSSFFFSLKLLALSAILLESTLQVSSI